MITDEQIKNLKAGDIVLVEAKVESVKLTGITVLYGSIARPLPFNKLYPIPEQSKHNPCRLFKAGDEVEYRPKDGRANPNLLVGRRYKVAVDEPCDSGIVQVEFDGLRNLDTFVAYNNLQLVTPVEELEPYSVQESDAFDIVRDGKIVLTIPFTVDDYYDYEQAKTAAKDWCKHLNTEWQKLQTLIKTTICQTGQE